MKKQIQTVKNYFIDIDREPEIEYLISDRENKKENIEAIKKFENSKSKHLKLSLKHLNRTPKKKKRVVFNRQRKKQLDGQRRYFNLLSLEVESLILKEKGEKNMLKVNLEHTNVNVYDYQERVNEIHKMLHEKTNTNCEKLFY